MKVDYLEEGSDDCPLIRLCDFPTQEAQKLKQAFEALASNSKKQLALNDIVSLQSPDQTQLIFTCGLKDQGVVSKSANRFEVVLTPTAWQQVAGLTEPFCKSSNGYQWLCEIGGIRLLLSPKGSW